MIINEFTTTITPVPIMIICVISAMIAGGFFVLCLVRKIRKFAITTALTFLIIGLSSQLVSVIFLDTTFDHQYYSYNNQEEVGTLKAQGWEVVADYENRKIVHIKRER